MAKGKTQANVAEVVKTTEVVENAEIKTIIVGDEQHTYVGDKLKYVIDSNGNLKELQ